MKVINTVLICCLFFLASVLPGCSSDTEIPPERPIGVISGKVVDSSISGAQVTAYAFADGIRGARLDGTTTDSEGDYSLEIQSRDQFILIEATGGSYVEQATGRTVTVPNGQVLQAIVHYESGLSINVTVTPLTHLVSGLANYKIENGQPVTQAVPEAQSAINQYFTIDTTNDIPLDITDHTNTVSALSSEALYGFYLAAISNWSSWISEKNQVTPHTVYTSMGAIQVMYNDIQADGILDGIGYDLNRSNLMPLALGVVPLNTELYRAVFSLHLLAISNASNNATNLKPGNLQQIADDIASKSSPLFADETPLDIGSEVPILELAQPLQEAYSGTLVLELTIGGYLGAETISASIDGNFVSELQNSTFSVETTDFTEEEDHTLSFLATDILGNTATLDLTVRFDNTNPIVNVTSSPVTNTSPATISGTYSDNLSGINTILVNDQVASLDQAGNWSVNVELVSGENVIQVHIVDNAGNETIIQTVQYLDLIPPVIDTSTGHSEARFSTGSGTFNPGPLLDTNDASALYFETDRLDLMNAGIAIEREALDNNLIPYFAFTVTDEIMSGTPTDVTDITVRVQYEKDGEILNPWHEPARPNTGNEYLIPLASETLSSDWHQATQFDTHSILVEVADPSGNVSTKTFSFRADFQVSALDTADFVITDPGTSVYTATAFQDRSDLNGLQYESIRYQTIKNPVDKSIYIQPQDNATHSVSQVIEQLIKEHQYRLVTYTEWQIRLMTPASFQPCPSDTPDAWQTVAGLFNWENNTWVSKSVPEPVQGEIEFASSDNLPTNPGPTTWSDVPHFDQDFTSTQISSGSIVSYEFDYVLEANPTSPAAYVRNWQLQEGGSTTNCPEARFFQQREVPIYESEPGFPSTVTSEFPLSNMPGFFSTGFTVFDIDADAFIQPINGWYQIPASHSFTITKLVTNPSLVNYNDELIDANANYTTPLWYDKSITWSVNRELDVLVIHDTGESNILDMTQVDNLLGSGFSNYLIAR